MKRISELLIDDLDGTPADESVAFALDGRDYTIDLSSPHALELRMALDRYIANGQRVPGGPRKSRPPVAIGEEERRAQIREWALTHNMQVATHGRISARVVAAWEDRDTTRPAGGKGQTGPATKKASATASGSSAKAGGKKKRTSKATADS